MVALLSLKCFSKNAKAIWIASNADSAGAFDDIILHAEFTAKECLTCMLQLKHKESPKNVTEQEFLSAKGDFSLQKYCSDINKLKLPSDSRTKNCGIVGELADFDNINFVLFTNRGVVEYEFLDKVCDSNSELSILNTNKSNFTCYQFNFNKLSYSANIGSHDCKNLYLFSSQAHAKHLNKEISAEITKIIGKLQLTHVNIKFVVERYTKFIMQWAMGDLGGHYYLTKQDICCKLNELLFCQYEVDLCEEYGLYIEDERYIWNKIVSNKVVTVVDADDHVLKFLKCYLGSMVKKYIPKHELINLWTDSFSEQAQQLFYEENDSLKVQMLKIVGNQGSITLLDVYKCLWFHNKLPLLLEVNNKQEYKNIMQILKLSNHTFKVVICNRGSNGFTITEEVPRPLITLDDLDYEERSTVLDRPVKFQGRSATPLRKLIGDDLFDKITCKDIIYILSNDFNIGNKYKSVADYFVERILSKIFIKPEAVSATKDEIFLIQKISDVTNGMPENHFANVIIGDENGCWKKVEELKSQGTVIHRLAVCDSCMEWKETFGSIKNLRKYLLEENEGSSNDEEIDVKDLVRSNRLNTARIISAGPGMGKSTLLDYVAMQMFDMWILRVDLNDHHEYYESMKHKSVALTSIDYLTYFNDFNLEKRECNNIQLARLVFEKFLTTHSILVLLDGFDEISIHCKDEVTKIAKSLHNDGYMMWITTRPNMKSYLEEQLNTLSVTLKPFTKHDQVYFLTKYFRQVCGNSAQEPLIVNFIMKLLQAAKTNLNDWCLDFMGVPLQTMLLADVFSEQLKISLRNGIVNFNEKFDMVYLYEEFINRKIKICCSKFGIGSKNLHVFLKEHQQLFALKYLFDKEDVQEFDLNGKLEEYYKEHQKIDFLQLEGVLVVHKNDNEKKFEVSFVHRTFAEFLAAQWFAEKVISKDANVKRYMKVLLGEDKFKCADYFYSLIFTMFNCILAKNRKAHLALIHGQTDELKQIIKSSPNALDVIDAGGRTVLHLMAIYSVNYLTCFEVSDVEDKILSIIKEVPPEKITGKKDFILGYSALDYALVNWNLEVANVMCEKSQTLTVNVEILMPTQYFGYCAQFKLKSLFKVLLLHFTREHALFWKYGSGRNMSISRFCSTHLDSANKCLEDFARDFGVASVWELFQFENLNDLRFAAAYGTKEILLFLLSKGAKINSQDLYGNTALHYAASHERPTMVRLLLSQGAAVDVAGRKGCTALHHAAKSGCKKIVNQLLDRGANVNKQNDKGQTPFNFALKYHKLNVAKLLLVRGAKSNIKTYKGKTSLHYAAKNGLHEIIIMLLPKPAASNNDNYNVLGNEDSVESLLCSSVNINYQDKNGRTPLHSSMKWPLLKNNEALYRHQATVHLILESGADVNAQDKDGNTALHYICNLCSLYPELRKKFATYVVELLLQKGANLVLQNKQGQTALDVAVHYEREEIVSILQRTSNDQAEAHEVTSDPPVGLKVSWLDCILF